MHIYNNIVKDMAGRWQEFKFLKRTKEGNKERRLRTPVSELKRKRDRKIKIRDSLEIRIHL